jgi:methyl-accepting chemotaxis protein
MTTFILILVLVTIAAGTVIFLQKSGKIADKDGDLIPDVVEEKVEEVKEVVKEVKTRAKKVATEVGDVAKAVKEVAKQSKDVVNAAKTSTGARRGRKPAQK